MPLQVFVKSFFRDLLARTYALVSLSSALALSLSAPNAEARPLAAPQTGVSLGPVRILDLYNPALGDLSLLSQFENPAIERLSPAQAFLQGPWGIRSWTDYCPESYSLPVVSANWIEPLAAINDEPSLALSWKPQRPLISIPIEASTPFKGLALSFDRAPLEPESLKFSISSVQAPLFDSPPCLRKPITFVRYGAETDKFSLLACDGSIAPDAIDRLSVVARPVNIPRPELPLRDAPDPQATHGEWEPSIKLVNPRLLWIVQRISDSFANRPIYVISGYRRGEHEGMHGQARGLDMLVMGVSKEKLYAFCRTLQDVGCGYYPNHDFVHVDVRPTGTGKAFWIDASQPGQPSEYVDGWPGVESKGALSWMQSGRGAVGD